jgi:Uri superfamily endonuclease
LPAQRAWHVDVVMQVHAVRACHEKVPKTVGLEFLALKRVTELGTSDVDIFYLLRCDFAT